MALDFIKKLTGIGKETPTKVYNPVDPVTYAEYNKFRPLGAQKHLCYVPFSSLTFSFRGQVFACSYNRRVLLGSYPEQTITEIWEGAEANKLRDHMRNNDLHNGCEHCLYFFDKKKFTNLKPLVFDKYAKLPAKLYPQVMEFELSNTCNLECQMCIGEVSSSIRKNRDKLPALPMAYDEQFVEQLRHFIPNLKEAKFYGGEPFLIWIYFEIWDAIMELNPAVELFVITNGTQWNERIKNILYKGNFDIAISIDALNKEKLERIRKNVVLENLLENIDHFNAYCLSKGRPLSLSFTVQKDNWDEMPAMIDFCNQKQAFIYVSYLETPEEFSIAELDKTELESIYNQLKDYRFAEGTEYEKHNSSCYQDFLKYLQTYIQNEDEVRYMEYRFSNEIAENAEKMFFEKQQLYASSKFTEAEAAAFLARFNKRLL